MAEKEERTEFEYTYTYDNFTVFFYGDRVYIGDLPWATHPAAVTTAGGIFY